MKRLLMTALCAVLAAGFATAQADLQPAALVKLTRTEPITVKQLKAEVQKIEAETSRTLSAAERRQVLDVMINERLALQAAERDKVTVTDAELNGQLQQSRAAMAQALGRQPTDAEFEAAVKSETGLDMAAFREQMRRQMTVQRYLLQAKRSVLESIKSPTENEIREQYELNKAKLIRPDTVRFSLIFVPYGADADARAKSKALAERLAKDIGSSASKFDEAVVRAQAAGSGYQAGDGGYLPRTSEAQRVVGQEFMTVAFAMKQGEVSRLMENARGYQIIKVTETYSQKLLDLDDVQQLGSRNTVRENIAAALFQQKQQAVFEAASNQLVQELRAGNPFQVFDKNLTW